MAIDSQSLTSLRPLCYALVLYLYCYDNLVSISMLNCMTMLVSALLLFVFITCEKGFIGIGVVS